MDDDNFMKFLEDVQHFGNQNTQGLENHLSSIKDSESERLAENVKFHEKIHQLRTKLSNIRRTGLEREEEHKRMITVQQKATGEFEKKLQNSLTTLTKWKTSRDELRHECLNALKTSTNVSRFVEHLGLGFGAAEDDSMDGQFTLYFTKVHPVDINRKYYIYFSSLRLKHGLFKVSTVFPKFSGFDSIKEEVNEGSFIDLIALCLEKWKNDISSDV